MWNDEDGAAFAEEFVHPDGDCGSITIAIGTRKNVEGFGMNAQISSRIFIHELK